MYYIITKKGRGKGSPLKYKRDNILFLLTPQTVFITLQYLFYQIKSNSAPSGPPSINVTFPNETTIFLNLIPPLPRMRNGNITGYMVYYKKSASSGPFSEISTSSAMVLVNNLTVFTDYDVKAAAATNAGTGIPSNVMTIKTGEGGMTIIL